MTERRYDPTRGEWVTFATHRQNRTFLPPADQCPLCPTAPGGPPTEIPAASYDLVTFDNRFPSFTADPPEPSVAGDALTPVAPALGRAEVVVFTGDHDATLAELPVARLRALVDVWADRTTVLGRRPEIGYVFPFENKGEEIGVTLNHPHGQIYGYPDIPPIPAQEIAAARRYRAEHGSCVWCDLVIREETSERLVVCGDAFAAYVPFWARFPYQVYISARRHALLPCPRLPRRNATTWHTCSSGCWSPTTACSASPCRTSWRCTRSPRPAATATSLTSTWSCHRHTGPRRSASTW